jgi:hypothetical protein
MTVETYWLVIAPSLLLGLSGFGWLALWFAASGEVTQKDATPVSARAPMSLGETESILRGAERALLGFIAAALSVLIFHQAMWEALHVLALPGLAMPRSYPTDPIGPFGIPRILNLCFWGGMYGSVFGVVLPRLTGPLWLYGIGLGIIGALIGLLVVPAIKGLPIGGDWQVLSWVRSLLINGFWGLGVGLLLPLMIRLVQRQAWRKNSILR